MNEWMNENDIQRDKGEYNIIYTRVCVLEDHRISFILRFIYGFFRTCTWQILEIWNSFINKNHNKDGWFKIRNRCVARSLNSTYSTETFTAHSQIARVRRRCCRRRGVALEWMNRRRNEPYKKFPRCSVNNFSCREITNSFTIATKLFNEAVLTAPDE
jgi:hypothetical protein